MLPVGGTFTLTALDVQSWESSDPTIATIVPTGPHTAVVTGKTPGTVIITVTGCDGKGVATITVVPAPLPTREIKTDANRGFRRAPSRVTASLNS